MYSLPEVRCLVEGYRELTELRYKEWVCVRLLDLERAMPLLPLNLRVYIFLMGLCGYTTRDAAELLEIPHATIARRYQDALIVLAGTMSGGKVWQVY